jgi:hypothetical protein
MYQRICNAIRSTVLVIGYRRRGIIAVEEEVVEGESCGWRREVVCCEESSQDEIDKKQEERRGETREIPNK